MAMLPPKRVLIWFSVRLSCLLGILMFPWPGFGKTYGHAAGELGNLIVGEAPLGSGATLRFDVPVEAQDRTGRNEFNTELRARQGRNALHIPIELRTLTYIPTAVFIALALASPIWVGLRGIIVLLVGLVLLHAFLLVSVAVPLLLFFADPTPMKLVELSAPVNG